MNTPPKILHHITRLQLLILIHPFIFFTSDAFVSSQCKMPVLICSGGRNTPVTLPAYRPIPHPASITQKLTHIRLPPGWLNKATIRAHEIPSRGFAVPKFRYPHNTLL